MPKDAKTKSSPCYLTMKNFTIMQIVENPKIWKLFWMYNSTVPPPHLLVIGCCILLTVAVPVMLHLLGQNEIAIRLVQEDGLYETAGALFSLLGGLIFLFAYWQYPLQTDQKNRPCKHIFYLLFALFLLFLFVEEISWGQRLFGISLPQNIADLNFQGELNFHNNKIFQKSNNALATYGVKLLLLYLVLPPVLTYTFPKSRKWILQYGVPISSPYICLLTFSNYLLIKFTVFIFGTENQIIHSYRIMEIFELNLELILFLFAIEVVRNPYSDIQQIEDR